MPMAGRRCRQLLLLLLSGCTAEKTEDLVTSLPGFPPGPWPFRAYSGFLSVTGPINGYDSLRIHYQFHTSQGAPARDPVVAWHQGGPGSSSILLGLYGEMGAFRLGDHGGYLNPWAWNKVANMLYLESPAGSGGPSGYSACFRGGKPAECQWDDVTQAQAYAHTLRTFFQAFPEFSNNDFYLTGESYFGQYGPNIAHFIVNNEPFRSSLNLKGIALGNACWGGNETCVACNGPSEDKVDADFFFGKGLYSPKLRVQIEKACAFPETYTSCDTTGDDLPGHEVLSSECKELLKEMFRQVGPHNVYDVYDNCNRTSDFLRRTGQNMGWLASKLRRGMHSPMATRAELSQLNGGYDWDCLGDADGWITSPAVREALHLDAVQPGTSNFSYRLSGPASITLYPEIVKKMRVLIFNGDADACVPYNGNEKWIGDLEERGVLREHSPWKPWYTSTAKSAPAGYMTKYEVDGSDRDFSFATVRLAGHMVPQFTPEPAFVLMSTFLAGREAPTVEVVI